MNNKKRAALFTVVTIFIMVIIFYFSSQTGAESELISGGIESGFESFLSRLFGTDGRMGALFGALEYVIRKAAHLFIFFCLGYSASEAVYGYYHKPFGAGGPQYEKKNAFTNAFRIDARVFVITAAFCFLYAATDELHQLFVEGRSAQFSDVLIDAAGSSAGAYLSGLINRIKRTSRGLRNRQS